MFFKDVIGQEDAKQRLIREVNEGKIPHARLFCGGEGIGKLPLAIAYARYLSCEHRSETDACGTCPNCMKYNKLAHPDLHFVFPVIKKKSGKDTVSDDFLPEWRELLESTPYFNFGLWLKEMGAENQQAQIYVKESDEILRKLSLKSSQGGYKVMIIWLPEKMNVDCSNKLLKLLEEPPAQTVFLNGYARSYRIAEGENGEDITHAEFRLDKNDLYFRITVRDKYGNNAHTHFYPVEDYLDKE
jgi:DNA polymerase-3 subunit delta'